MKKAKLKLVKRISAKKGLFKIVPKEKAWQANPFHPNIILEGKTFFISYNGMKNMDEISNAFSVFGRALGRITNDGGEETALVKRGEFGYNKYYILNGDFRKDYEKIIDKGFKACKKFYDSKKKKYRNDWSTD